MPYKIVKKICPVCGIEFLASSNRKFCSNLCVGKYNSNRQRYPDEPTKAELIGLYYHQKLGIYQIATKLKIPVSCIQRRMNKFNIKLRPQTLAQKVAAEEGRTKTGSKSLRWKGGRKHRGKGDYIRLYKPNHPRAKDKYIAEHIYVWEEFYKKMLPADWIIHHINGKKDDNRIENLEAMPKGKHSGGLVNLRLQEKIRKLEAIIKMLKARMR